MKPIVLIGAPGSGKGTQGAALASYFGVPHISTGSILRDLVQRNTAIGQQVKGLVDRGELVPDNLLLDLVCSRLSASDCKQGYILDGFPRTLQQAQWFYAHYTQPIVISLDVPEEESVRRILNRNEGRADDQAVEIIQNRFAEYNARTAPLVNYYEREAVVHHVDGTLGVNRVFAEIRHLLEN